MQLIRAAFNVPYMIRVFLCLLLIGLSQNASAQDVTGELTSVVNRGETNWQIALPTSNRKSYWRQFPGSLQVKITGLAVNAPNQSGRSMLSVAFYLLDPLDGHYVEEVDVVFTERGLIGAYVTEGHGDGSIIDLQAVQIAGDMLTVKGRFEVTLVYTDDFGVTLKRSNTRHITGFFETSVKRR